LWERTLCATAAPIVASPAGYRDIQAAMDAFA
jgi:hypothetical protein